MSNGDTYVKVRSEGVTHLKGAIELAMIYHSGGKSAKMTHWLVHEGAIYFGWGAGVSSSLLLPLPTAMGVEALVGMIQGWLAEQDYPREPDCDGSVHKGFELISHWELMPDVPSRFYLQFGVRPYWMEYHK